MEQHTEHTHPEHTPRKNGKQDVKRVQVDVEIFVKIFSVVATLLGLGIGIWQFLAQQANNNRMEFRRKIWEKQMDTYNQLGELVGKASVAKDDTVALKELLKQYEEFSWGKLSIFQDSVLESYMDDYKTSIRSWIAGNRDLSDDDPIRTKAFALMHHCDTSLKSKWQQLSD